MYTSLLSLGRTMKTISIWQQHPLPVSLGTAKQNSFGMKGWQVIEHLVPE